MKHMDLFGFEICTGAEAAAVKRPFSQFFFFFFFALACQITQLRDIGASAGRGCTRTEQTARGAEDRDRGGEHRGRDITGHLGDKGEI